jgi:Biotin carboxylase
MKRLLVLGGTRGLIPIVKTAQQLGCYVITCDYLPDNIAHKYSDAYCYADLSDKEAVLEAAKALHIDGVLTFATDYPLLPLAYVAETLGLPAVGSYESVSILQNKGKFRRFLAEHGFQVPTAKSYQSIAPALKDVELFHWPVIVKPTDSSGSRGVRKVEHPEDLKSSIEYALSFSRSYEFIIEDYIPQKGYASDSDCFSVDGKLEFVSFNSQRFDQKAENPHAPVAYSWPSSMPMEKQELLRSELQRLITLLGLKSSIYNIETREGIDGNVYIMECSPRGGGNKIAECVERATGVKLLENTVRAAVGMPIENMEFKGYNGFWTQFAVHSYQTGHFREVWIDEAVKKYLVDLTLWVAPGDEVRAYTSVQWVVGLALFHFDSKAEWEAVSESISDYVKVLLD